MTAGIGIPNTAPTHAPTAVPGHQLYTTDNNPSLRPFSLLLARLRIRIHLSNVLGPVWPPSGCGGGGILMNQRAGMAGKIWQIVLDEEEYRFLG